MANLYDRILSTNDYETDGGYLAAPFLGDLVQCFASGLLTAATIKSMCQMTTPQGDDLDEILATQPAGGLLSLVNAKAVSQWPQKVKTVLCMAQTGYDPFNTETEMRTSIGT